MLMPHVVCDRIFRAGRDEEREGEGEEIGARGRAQALPGAPPNPPAVLAPAVPTHYRVAALPG